MRTQVQGVAVAAAIALGLTPRAYAKPPLERIVISGGGLVEPVIVGERETLDLSNPWYGRIADWKADTEAPPNSRPVYEITLHARLRGSDLKPIYLIRYVKGEAGSPGVVYLPGRGEAWYHQNLSIIYREGHDGHWHAAAPTWEAHIQQALATRQR